MSYCSKHQGRIFREFYLDGETGETSNVDVEVFQVLCKKDERLERDRRKEARGRSGGAAAGKDVTDVRHKQGYQIKRGYRVQWADLAENAHGEQQGEAAQDQGESQ